MVAKKSRRSDRQAILSLHLEACQHRALLLAEARELQAAGRIREARVVAKTLKYLRAHVTALETEYLPKWTRETTRTES
jgi:hypothetical protein